MASKVYTIKLFQVSRTPMKKWGMKARALGLFLAGVLLVSLAWARETAEVEDGFARALRQYRLGNYYGAESTLRQALEKYPEDGQVQSLLQIVLEASADLPQPSDSDTTSPVATSLKAKMKEYRRLERLLETAEERIATLNQMLVERQLVIGELRDKLASTIARSRMGFGELRQQLSETRQTHTTVLEQLAQIQADRDTLRITLTEAQRRNLDQQEELEWFKETLRDKEKQLAEAKELLAAHERRLSSMETLRDELLSQNAQFQKQLEGSAEQTVLVSKLTNELERVQQDLLETRSALNQTKEQMKQEAEAFEAELREGDMEKRQLEQDSEDVLAGVKDEYESELDEWRSDFAQLKGRLDALEEERESLRMRVSNLTQDKAALYDRISELTTVVRQSGQQVPSEEDAVKEREILDQQEEILRLSEQLEKRDRFLNTIKEKLAQREQQLANIRVQSGETVEFLAFDPERTQTVVTELEEKPKIASGTIPLPEPKQESYTDSLDGPVAEQEESVEHTSEVPAKPLISEDTPSEAVRQAQELSKEVKQSFARRDPIARVFQVNQRYGFFVLGGEGIESVRVGAKLLLHEDDRPLAEVEVRNLDPMGFVVAYIKRRLSEELADIEVGSELAFREIL